MASEPLVRTSYIDPLTNLARTGSTAHYESRLDQEQYQAPLERVHGSALHGWGIAEGLALTATNGNQLLWVQPGVAVDASGRHIVLAESGQAETNPNADDGYSTTLADVTAAGAQFSTATKNGTFFVTLTWHETFDEDLWGTSGEARCEMRHTPWIRLESTADDTGHKIVLGRVTIDAAGNVTAITPEGRRAAAVPAGTLKLWRAATLNSGTTLKAGDVPAGEVAARAAGGLEIKVAGASDEIAFRRDGGNITKVGFNADVVTARSASGTDSVVLDTTDGSVSVGARGTGLRARPAGGLEVKVAGATDQIDFKRDGGNIGKVGFNADVVAARDASGVETVVIDSANAAVKLGTSGAAVASRTGGGLELKVGGASDQVEFKRDGGNFAKVGFNADTVTARSAGGTDAIVLDTVNGSVSVGAKGNGLRARAAGGLEVNVAGAADEIDFKRDGGNIGKVGFNADVVTARSTSGADAIILDTTNSSVSVGAKGTGLRVRPAGGLEVKVAGASDQIDFKRDGGNISKVGFNANSVVARNASGVETVAIDTVNAAIKLGTSGTAVGTRTGGGLELKVAGASDQVEFKRDGGNISKVGFNADAVAARNASGVETVVIDSANAAVKLGATGSAVRARNGGGLELKVAGAADQVEFKCDSGNFAKVGFNADLITGRSANGAETVVIDTKHANITLGSAGNEGDVVVTDGSNRRVIILDGSTASVNIGAPGNEGDIRVFNANGGQSFRVDGAPGDTWFAGALKDPNGHHSGIGHDLLAYMPNLPQLCNGGSTGLHKHNNSGNAAQARTAWLWANASGTTQTLKISFPTSRRMTAMVSLTTIDPTDPFDRADLVCAEIYQVDGQDYRWGSTRYGGDHLGGDGADANLRAPYFTGWAREITFRIRSFVNVEAGALCVVFPEEI